VLAAIRDIVEQFDTAAIYITHDLAVVAQMADRIKVLLRARRSRRPTPAPCCRRPTQDYTKSLWAVRSLPARERRPRRRGTPVVSVRNVTAGYGPVRVLDDVSFDIHARRTVAVVGESGSGKSTAARVITGLLPPKRARCCSTAQPLPPTTAAHAATSCARRR
jgi:peptide/nickel transport system ATP-binding protein